MEHRIPRRPVLRSAWIRSRASFRAMSSAYSSGASLFLLGGSVSPVASGPSRGAPVAARQQMILWRVEHGGADIGDVDHPDQACFADHRQVPEMPGHHESGRVADGNAGGGEVDVPVSARWLIRNDVGEVFSTDSRTSCGRAARSAARDREAREVPSRAIDPSATEAAVLGSPVMISGRESGRSRSWALAGVMDQGPPPLPLAQQPAGHQRGDLLAPVTVMVMICLPGRVGDGPLTRLCVWRGSGRGSPGSARRSRLRCPPARSGRSAAGGIRRPVGR